MTVDLAAVAREAAARWRRDRGLLLPVAGLLLFLPQWAVLLFVPEVPALPAGTGDAAAIGAWAAAAQRWAQVNGPLYLAAFLLAQWGQLALVGLYVGGGDAGGKWGGSGGERPTVGAALARAGWLLPRYVLAELLVSVPLAGAVLAGSLAGPVLVLLLPAVLWVLGRTLLVAPAMLTRPAGAARAVALSWRWTRGHGAALALVAGVLVVGAPLLVALVKEADALIGAAHLATRVTTAALDALAAAIAAAAMLALSMLVAVFYRRLAR